MPFSALPRLHQRHARWLQGSHRARRCYSWFFFFQAEDGIRDLTVTGVQTCALPIYQTFGETTCNIGVISGGTRANVIPNEAYTLLQIRLAVEADAAKSLLEGVVNERAALDYKSVHDPVRLMAIEGFEQMIARFTTDIPYLPNWGQPLLIGPGSILDAHTEHERVKQDDLVGAVTIYSDLVRRLLKHD